MSGTIKITNDVFNDIKSLVERSKKQRGSVSAIAKIFGVSTSLIYYVKQHKTYSDYRNWVTEQTSKIRATPKKKKVVKKSDPYASVDPLIKKYVDMQIKEAFKNYGVENPSGLVRKASK